MSNRPKRNSFMVHALNLMGTPYVWGGKSPAGIDCSGVVTLALHQSFGPDWRKTHWTDKLWNELPVVPEMDALPGDLIFYGGKSAQDVAHVMVLGPLGIAFGASGGDSTCVSVQIARERGARVRAYDDVRYRPDLRGFRRLPLVA